VSDLVLLKNQLLWCAYKAFQYFKYHCFYANIIMISAFTI